MTIPNIDILIITIGTRQVGWQCEDGKVRCFGTDGGKSAPPHIDELYQELQIERSNHDPKTKWGVRNLGETYYRHCQEERNYDFNPVILLMDQKIIDDLTNNGLKTILLWATNNPEEISWRYRALDTLWLAKLMAEKIKHQYPVLTVDVIDSCVNAAHSEALYAELEGLILPFAIEQTERPAQEKLSIAIQTKGSTPMMASAVEIYFGALVRQFKMYRIIPQEPPELYVGGDAQPATKYDNISVSRYLWQLEKERIKTTWKRGDFNEAKIWLESHQDEHQILSELADFLNIARNGEIERLLTSANFRKWLDRDSTQTEIGITKIQQWKKKLVSIRKNDIEMAWESIFLIRVNLLVGFYTNAFFGFVQLLERLLFIRSIQDDWLSRDRIEIPSDWDSSRGVYSPNFDRLIKGLEKSISSTNESRNKIKLLHELRKFRNNIVHKGLPVTYDDLRKLWTSQQLEFVEDSNAAVYNKFIEILQWTIAEQNAINQSTFLESLYAWGLQVLE